MERSDFICSGCGAYKDPQSLDHTTGKCGDCQDGIVPCKPSKMYILIVEDVPNGHAINSAAHASLAAYLAYGEAEGFQKWLRSSFKKVTCKVSLEQLDQAIALADQHVIIRESVLDDAIMGAAFAPREEWDPFFKTLPLWR